jgi:hypothetical protein
MTGDLIHDASTNGGPPLDPPSHPSVAAFKDIDDLYDTAKDFADGQPIADAAMAEVITAIHDQLHDAGKRAEALRVEEKKPLDEAVAEIQNRYNPYVQDKKGKVARGKAALGELLTVWRKKVADEAARIAEINRVAAAQAAAAAQEAIRASSGNLAAREDAEALLKDAKVIERTARRSEKAATIGTGLRSVWSATLDDQAAALDWAWATHQASFLEFVQGLADTAVRNGARAVPGFKIVESKVATRDMRSRI